MYTIKKYTTEKQFLYVCGKLTKKMLRSISPDELILAVHPDDACTPAKDNIIHIQSDMETAEIFNLLQEIYAVFQDWDRRMHEALIQNASFQELIDISAPLIQNPILIYDLSLKLLAYDHSNEPDDAILQQAITEGYLHPDVMHHFEKAGIFDPKEAIDPIIFSPPHTDAHTTMYLPFYQNNQITGYCVILLMHHSPGEYDACLFRNFYEYASLCMNQHLRSRTTEGFMYEYALTDLLMHPDMDETTVQNHLEYVGIPYQSEFYLLMLHFQDPSGSALTYLLHQLRTILPKSCVFEFEKKLLILIYDNTNIGLLQYRQQIPVYYSNLQREVSIYDVFCAASMPFYQITDFRVAYNAVKSVTELQPLLNPAKQEIYFFEDYLVHQTCNLVRQHVGKSAMIPPGLRILLQKDKEKETQYAHLLRTYLEENCRVTETAARLHMHRNNVIYHIHRIENRYRLNLENPKERMNLMLSFYLLDLNQ